MFKQLVTSLINWSAQGLLNSLRRIAIDNLKDRHHYNTLILHANLSQLFGADQFTLTLNSFTYNTNNQALINWLSDSALFSQWLHSLGSLITALGKPIGDCTLSAYLEGYQAGCKLRLQEGTCRLEAPTGSFGVPR